MDLNLYICEDADNTIGKTLEDETVIDIKLHRDFDITNPVFILKSDSNLDFRNFNYATIPDMKRAYFIDSVKNIANELWEVTCHCDVLETYKDDIYAANARIMRNIRVGDYAGNIDAKSTTTISRHNSDKGLLTGETMLLTTVGA